MQQQMLVQDDETLELRETFTSLQQEVEAKTKKLKKVKYPQIVYAHLSTKMQKKSYKCTYSKHAHLCKERYY